MVLSTITSGSPMGIWCHWGTASGISAVTYSACSTYPKSYLLSEMADEYLALRKIELTPPRVALKTFISLAMWSLTQEMMPRCLSFNYRRKETRQQRSGVGSTASQQFLTMPMQNLMWTREILLVVCSLRARVRMPTDVGPLH